MVGIKNQLVVSYINWERGLRTKQEAGLESSGVGPFGANFSRYNGSMALTFQV